MMPITAYRAISWNPSNQVDSPSDTSALHTSPAISSAAISYTLNTIAKGDGPTANDSNTSTGATNSPICAPEPIAMLTARSILSLAAATTATKCSAALPTIATTNAPTKNWERPSSCEACSIESTRMLLISATRAAARASVPTDRPTDQTLADSPCTLTGLNRSRCVRSEKNRPAMYVAISTRATEKETCSISSENVRRSSETVGRLTCPASSRSEGSASAATVKSSIPAWV